SIATSLTLVSTTPSLTVATGAVSSSAPPTRVVVTLPQQAVQAVPTAVLTSAISPLAPPGVPCLATTPPTGVSQQATTYCAAATVLLTSKAWALTTKTVAGALPVT